LKIPTKVTQSHLPDNDGGLGGTWLEARMFHCLVVEHIIELFSPVPLTQLSTAYMVGGLEGFSREAFCEGCMGFYHPTTWAVIGEQ